MSGPVCGGWQEQDINDPEIKAIVEKAVTHYNQQSNDAYHHKLVKVHSVHSQVVAGINYKIKFDLGKTEKKKGENVGAEEPVSTTKTVTCTHFSQPWTQTEDFKFE